MTPADRLAALPEPLQAALAALVDAGAGLDQGKKATVARALLHTAARTDVAAMGDVLQALAVVIDELHTSSTSGELRVLLEGTRTARRELLSLLRAEPELVETKYAGVLVDLAQGVK